MPDGKDTHAPIEKLHDQVVRLHAATALGSMGEDAGRAVPVLAVRALEEIDQADNEAEAA